MYSFEMVDSSAKYLKLINKFTQENIKEEYRDFVMPRAWRKNHKIYFIYDNQRYIVGILEEKSKFITCHMLGGLAIYYTPTSTGYYDNIKTSIDNSNESLLLAIFDFSNGKNKRLDQQLIEKLSLSMVNKSVESFLRENFEMEMPVYKMGKKQLINLNCLGKCKYKTEDIKISKKVLSDLSKIAITSSSESLAKFLLKVGFEKTNLIYDKDSAMFDSYSRYGSIWFQECARAAARGDDVKGLDIDSFINFKFGDSIRNGNFSLEDCRSVLIHLLKFYGNIVESKNSLNRSFFVYMNLNNLLVKRFTFNMPLRTLELSLFS